MESPQLMLPVYAFGFQSIGLLEGIEGERVPRVSVQESTSRGAGVSSGRERAAQGAPMLLPCRFAPLLPLPSASLPTFLTAEIPSDCSGWLQAPGISLLHQCSGTGRAPAPLQTLPWGHDPDPRGNSPPPTDSPVYLHTAAAP